MSTRRVRLIVQGDTIPALKAHVLLRFDDLRKAWVLLAPEHIYWPDEIAVAILRKLDGSRDVAAIITALAQDYDAPVADVGADVTEFLQTWADQRLIQHMEAR